MKIKIIVADDNPYLREGISRKLSTFEEFVIISEADRGDVLLKDIYKYDPDICIVDMYMDDMKGLSAIKTLKMSRNPIKILFISEMIDDEDLINLLTLKCNGIISKYRTHYEMYYAIQEIINGNNYYDNTIDKKRLEELSKLIKVEMKNTWLPEFTKRELEIMEKYSIGQMSQEISECLNISIDTVNYHKKNIMQKIGARKINQLICFASKYFIKRNH